MSLDNRDRIIDTPKALGMRLQGATYQQIADVFGVTRQAVHDRLRRLVKTDPDLLHAFKDQRADIFASLQTEILQSLDIKKLPEQVKVTQAAILYDKERLERGQSTNNVNVHNLTADISKIDDEICRLEQQIADMKKHDASD